MENNDVGMEEVMKERENFGGERSQVAPLMEPPGVGHGLSSQRRTCLLGGRLYAGLAVTKHRL